MQQEGWMWTDSFILGWLTKQWFLVSSIRTRTVLRPMLVSPSRILHFIFHIVPQLDLCRMQILKFNICIRPTHTNAICGMCAIQTKPLLRLLVSRWPFIKRVTPWYWNYSGRWQSCYFTLLFGNKKKNRQQVRDQASRRRETEKRLAACNYI